MEIRYDVTGEKRKALVKTISQAIGAEVQFQGVPSLAYRIGPFTVTRDGTLIPEDDIEQTIIEKVLTILADDGCIVMNSVKAPKVTTDSHQLWDEACHELALLQTPPMRIVVDEHHPKEILKCRR